MMPQGAAEKEDSWISGTYNTVSAALQWAADLEHAGHEDRRSPQASGRLV